MTSSSAPSTSSWGTDVPTDTTAGRWDLRAPRYGSRSLAELLPAVTSHLAGGAQTLLPLPRGVTGVVVLVVDGLGAALLREHRDLAPTLTASGLDTVVDAAFPATTAVNLTTVGTGLPPALHGIVGTGLRLGASTRPFHPLTWRWDRLFDGPDARPDVEVDSVQPHATAFARARDRGVPATVVTRPEFADSGLTRAALGGAHVAAAPTLRETLATAVRAVRTGGLAYAYHPELDTAGHLTGPGSDAWCDELATIDAEVARALTTAPSTTALVVTADHGMVAVPDDGFLDVAERPDLLDGVTLVVGDPRARQLHVRAGAGTEVAAAWREACGDGAVVLTRDDVLQRGWFGPIGMAVTDEVRARIGDLLVVATGPTAVVHGELDPGGGRLVGQHAAPTDDELQVPALVLTEEALP